MQSMTMHRILLPALSGFFIRKRMQKTEFQALAIDTLIFVLNCAYEL
jgi:hypothetical protein